MKKNHAGLILGSFFGIVHLLWAILVAVGVAQPLMDFIYRMHFLNNPFQVAKFEILNAVGLVVITFAVGYVAGWVLTFLWENIQGKK